MPRCGLQLRLQLPNLEFIGTTVELEKRLALLDWHIRFNEYGGHKSRFRKARNKLNCVLNDLQIRRVRGHEAEADDKMRNKWSSEERRDEFPRSM